MEREIQQNIKDTHNLVVQNIVNNQQVKFISFWKFQNERTLYRNGLQYRFVTGLIIAGRNFVKLFAIFQNNIAEQLGSYKIHEDITNILQWGKTIIIQTKHKIVGLIYQDSMLKNAFMVSLQFLPLTSNDRCKCIPDRKGLFFAVQVKNYLLICLSNLIISTYQSKPFYKPNCEIITEDVKWNHREDKPFVEQIIKVKLSQLDVCFIYDISICIQSIYYTTYKSFQKPNLTGEYGVHHLYRIPVQQFFNQNPAISVFNFLTKKDADVQHIYPYCFQRQIQYLYCKKDSLFIQDKNGMRIIQQFQEDQDGSYEILQKDQVQIFPLWIKTKGKVRVYLRKGNQIVQFEVLNDFYFQKLIAKHYKVAVYSTMTEVAILDIKNYERFLSQSSEFLKQKSIIHKSLGNIIDFAIIKNAIYLIENTDGHNCRFYQLKRQFSLDTKSYVLHGKKNKLQQLVQKSQPAIQQLKSFRLPAVVSSSLVYSNYIVTDNSVSYTIYKQIQTGFQLQMQGLIYYATTSLKGKIYFLTVNQNKQLFFTKIQTSIQNQNQMVDQKQELQLRYELPGDFNLKTQKWLVQDYLIYQLVDNVIQFFDIKSGEQFMVLFTLKQQKLIKFFFNKKTWTLSEKQKDQPVIQVIIIYENSLQIYDINLDTRDYALVHSSQNISQGLPLLVNLQTNNETFGKNRFRSITCPEYILSEYPIQEKTLKIVNALHYRYEDKELLIFINSDKEMIVYKKFINFSEQANYIYKRILLSLSIIKIFKWKTDQNQKQIYHLGEGIWKIGNIVLFKGQFLEHQVNSKCYFQMEKMLWTLCSSQNKDGKQAKIRMVDVKRQRGEQDTQVFFKPIQANLESLVQISSNFIKTQVRSLINKQIVGLQTTNQYLVLYSKSGFQIITQKDFKLYWKQDTQSIVKLKVFGNLLAMSYYDQYLGEDSQYKSVKFKFRIYNILSKTKVIEKEKATDEPILHIKPVGNDKIIIATSMTIFLCHIKSQKTLDIIKTKNVSRRGFMNCFAYIQELVSASKPGYMLFGNKFGGLSFFAGKWVQQQNLREIWYQQIKCQVRQVSLFHYGVQLKALVADEDCNLIVMNLKSDCLQKIADINVGSKVNTLKFKGQHDKVVYGCFQDGTIKTVLAVQLDNIDVSYLDFQEEGFCKQLPFIGGFNSRVSRLLNQQYRTYKLVSKGNIVDGQILQQFFGLTSSLKQYLCQKSEIQVQKIKGLLKSI